MIIQSDKLVPNPKVSVVIATYNQKEFIAETIMSALNQKCDFPFEIVVGDDGSNDGERDLLKDLQKTYPDKIKLVFNDENLMVTRNYVNAIHEARGEYIATLDGDDYYIDRDALKKLANYLDEHQDVSLVHAPFKGYDNEKGEFVYIKDKWQSPMSKMKGVDSVYALLSVNMTYYPLGSTCCFRRVPYLEGCNKYPKIIEVSSYFGEGTILNTSCAMTGKIAYLDSCITAYRILNNSLCHFENYEKKYKFQERYFITKLTTAISVGISGENLSKLFSLSLRKFRNNSYFYHRSELYYKTLKDLAGDDYYRPFHTGLNDELNSKTISFFKANIHNILGNVIRKLRH